MTAFRPSRLLRQALLADAAMSGAAGLLMATAAAPLGGLLDLPVALLRGAGLVLLPFAAFLGWLAGGRSLTRTTVRLVVAVNVLWTVESLALLAGWLAPNTLGTAFVLVQALAVALLAMAQHQGLRRSLPAPLPA